jgi:hypothetical protein
MEAKWIAAVIVSYVVVVTVTYAAAYGLGRRHGVADAVRTTDAFLVGLEETWRRRAVEEKGRPTALDVALELPGIVTARRMWARQPYTGGNDG